MRIATSLLPALALLASAGACTLILTPDEKADGVERCDTTEDCTPPADGRLQAACVFGEDQAQASQKVCTVDWETVSCATSNTSTARGTLYDEAVNSSGVYVDCAAENLGQRGCPPEVGVGCSGALEVVNGICQDPDAPLVVAPTADNKGLDVKDQYCRFYFCDDRFVCGQGDICRPCDASRDLGNGGCAELWINGAPSQIYMDQDQLDASCKGANPASDDPDAFANGLNEPL
jgi:hypothetical protein